MDLLTVYVKEPGKKLEERSIKNELKALQDTVGGYIETVTLLNGIVVICDKEGRLKGRPHSAYIDGIDFCGSIILAGYEGEEFSDCPLSMEEILKNYPYLGSDAGETEEDADGLCGLYIWEPDSDWWEDLDI